MASVTVDVDVDLDEFDSCDLIDELESRGYVVQGEKSSPVDSSPSDLIERLYYALDKNDQDTINSTATTLCYVLGGRIL